MLLLYTLQTTAKEAALAEAKELGAAEGGQLSYNGYRMYTDDDGHFVEDDDSDLIEGLFDDDDDQAEQKKGKGGLGNYRVQSPGVVCCRVPRNGSAKLISAWYGLQSGRKEKSDIISSYFNPGLCCRRELAAVGHCSPTDAECLLCSIWTLQAEAVGKGNRCMNIYRSSRCMSQLLLAAVTAPAAAVVTNEHSTLLLACYILYNIAGRGRKKKAADTEAEVDQEAADADLAADEAADCIPAAAAAVSEAEEAEEMDEELPRELYDPPEQPMQIKMEWILRNKGA